MRLDKALTEAGLTRSQARRAIADGRARVKGVVWRDAGLPCDIEDVSLDGRNISARGEVYLMMNKPAGVVTAMADARLGTVAELVPAEFLRPGLGPVGRLDRDVTGLVILTTDGQMAHRLISPRFKAEKVYRARVSGRADNACVEAFARGVPLDEFTARAARLKVLEAGEDSSLCEVTLTEGKFHQVKRMFAAVGHPVVALSRLSIGGVALDPALAPGESRPLTGDEVARLRRVSGMDGEEA